MYIHIQYCMGYNKGQSSGAHSYPPHIPHWPCRVYANPCSYVSVHITSMTNYEQYHTCSGLSWSASHHIVCTSATACMWNVQLFELYVHIKCSSCILYVRSYLAWERPPVHVSECEDHHVRVKVQYCASGMENTPPVEGAHLIFVSVEGKILALRV